MNFLLVVGAGQKCSSSLSTFSFTRLRPLRLWPLDSFSPSEPKAAPGGFPWIQVLGGGVEPRDLGMPGLFGTPQGSLTHPQALFRLHPLPRACVVGLT